MISRMMVLAEASELIRLFAQHGTRLTEKVELSFSVQGIMGRLTIPWFM